MAIVIRHTKKDDLLELQINYLNTLTLRLFTNDLTPTGASVAGDFTECADGGYASETDVDFQAAIVNSSNQGQTTAPAVTWIFTYSGGGFTIYGYYFTDPNDSGAVVFSERAAAPFTVTAAGQTYTVTPRVKLDTMA